jgi:hypothetical protein
MAQYFRDSGFESIALVSGVASAGTVINAPGVGKRIYLLGVNASGATELKETDANGLSIMYVAAGNLNLPATIKVTENTAVYSSAPYVSVIHYIDNA